jgi:hypothetical protein
MEGLDDILKKNNYRKIKFRITKTQHLLLNAKINGVKGNFILDTGASTSCVGFDTVARFNLETQKSHTLASGAGATGMFTQLSTDNELTLGRWKHESFHIVIFDLSHVNSALKEHKARPVHGIIGADILMRGKAIIDYHNQYLYLLK